MSGMDVARSEMTRRPVKFVLGLRRYFTSFQVTCSFFGRRSIPVLSCLTRLSQQIWRILGMLPSANAVYISFWSFAAKWRRLLRRRGRVFSRLQYWSRLAWLLNQALSHVHSICHLSRGAVKTEGISLHNGRTKVPGNMPMSFGRSASFMPWVLVLKDGCTWLGGRKFICLPRHCWEVSEKARH